MIADSLKQCYTGTNGCDGKASYASIRKMIDNQPTAYDVDKVVKQLEEIKHMHGIVDKCISIVKGVVKDE